MKKIKYIMLALILMLGLIGGAYAYWTDQVVVSGEVTTGSMEVFFSCAKAEDGDYEKAELIVFETGGSELVFKISNLFPKADPQNLDPGTLGNYAKIQFTIKNNGTIPVKLKSITADPVNDPAGLFPRLRAIAIGGPHAGRRRPLLPAGDFQTALDEIVAHYGETELAAGTQRTYGAYIWLDESVVNDDALQNATASFTITVEFRQFNAPAAP